MKKHEVHHAKEAAQKGEDSFMLDQSVEISQMGDNYDQI